MKHISSDVIKTSVMLIQHLTKYFNTFSHLLTSIRIQELPRKT